MATARKDLGVKTFLNLLGPLVNPARPSHQFIGVSSLELARMYTYLLQLEGTKFCLVHSLDGYDEISGTGAFKVFMPNRESLHDPDEFKLVTVSESDLFGGSSVAEAASVFLRVLKNEATQAQKEVVALNAAYAIHCYTGKLPEIAFEESLEALTSGNAFRLFTNLIKN